MIDTIVIKLHHVSKYPLTLTKFQSDTIKGETSALVNENLSNINDAYKVRSLLYHDTDNIIPLTKRSNYLIPSSHYLLSYFYKVQEDSVEFNFSIPKYLYSTNLFQFIPYFDQDSKSCYKLFKEFLNDFITSFFPERIDLSDFEINRIDLCYNQFFGSKNDALNYLHAQKEILVKYARSSKNKYKTWDTSLMYTTARYSFKIYHKGTEFKLKDRGELQKKNPKKLSIPDLQETSDRILRYEVTFRKSQLNYLFKKYQFENKYLPFDINNPETVIEYGQRQGGEVVTMFDRKTGRSNSIAVDKYRYCLEFAERSKTFFLGVEPWDAVVNMTAEFDGQLFDACFNFFWDYVKRFQLEPKQSIDEIKNSIDRLNSDIALKNKFSRKQDEQKEKSRLLMLALLAQSYPVKNLFTMGIIPRSTYFRYMKDLKSIGVLCESKLPVSVPKPDLDYLDYKYYFGRYHLK